MRKARGAEAGGAGETQRDVGDRQVGRRVVNADFDAAGAIFAPDLDQMQAFARCP